MGNCFSSDDNESVTPYRPSGKELIIRNTIRSRSSNLQHLEVSRCNSINTTYNLSQSIANSSNERFPNHSRVECHTINSGVLKALTMLKNEEKMDLRLVDGSLSSGIILQTKLRHPNIHHYFGIIDVDKTYLISEYYKSFLNAYLKREVPTKLILEKITNAVMYMQEKQIVHLDITPENIIVIESDAKIVNVKLTNFVYARKAPSSVPIYNYNAFTPPEVILTIQAHHRSDNWSLGRVLLELKNKDICSSNIHIMIEKIPDNSNENILCKDLLRKTLKKDPLERISATNILQHPFFWTVQDTLYFIIQVAVLLESTDFRSHFYKRSSKAIFGDDWTKRVSNNLLQEINKARTEYRNQRSEQDNEIIQIDGKKAMLLVSTIRNMCVHSRSDAVKNIVGESDEEFLKYWISRFPRLICFLYNLKSNFELSTFNS